MLFWDKILVSLAEQYEASIQEALALGRRQRREGKPSDVTSVNLPSLRDADGHEYFKDGANWYGTKVPLFHEMLAALADRALRGEKGTPEQHAAAWTFKYETGSKTVTFREAITWLKKIKGRVRKQSRGASSAD